MEAARQRSVSTELLRLIRLSRPFDAAYPLVSLFLGAAVAGYTILDAKVGLLAVVVVLLNSAAMLWNDIEDRHIDAKNGRTELFESSSGVIERIKIYAMLLLAASIMVAYMVSINAALLVLPTSVMLWVYNSRPVQASRRPIASVVVLSGIGAFLPYLYGVSLAGVTTSALVGGVFWWIGRISLSVLKDYKDALGDATYDKKTFLLRYGARWVARVSVVCFLLGYGGFVATMYGQAMGGWLSVLLLLAAMSAMVYLRRGLFAQTSSYTQFDAVFRSVGQYQLLLDIGLVAWLM